MCEYDYQDFDDTALDIIIRNMNESFLSQQDNDHPFPWPHEYGGEG